MKVLFPRNITKGLFNMHVSIGPLTITLVQMFILAIGISLALAVFNSVGGGEGGNKAIGMLAALPVFLISIFIAFFKVSELGLLAFGAKLLSSYFFDTTKKFQTNYRRFNPFDIMIKKIHVSEGHDIIKSKKLDIKKEEWQEIENAGLL